MKTLQEMQIDLCIEYEQKFASLKKIAYDLNKIGEQEIGRLVLRKMAGLKLMIDYLKSIIPEQL